VENIPTSVAPEKDLDTPLPNVVSEGCASISTAQANQSVLSPQPLLPQAVKTWMAAKIAPLNQDPGNFTVHIPPQAWQSFYPFIFKMFNAFSEKGMLRGRGRKPGESCYTRDYLIGPKPIAQEIFRCLKELIKR
jgi:hypothetical protein